jgi:hypothetical protein
MHEGMLLHTMLTWHVQVANLGLYGTALGVFGAVKAKECSDVVLQVPRRIKLHS